MDSRVPCIVVGGRRHAVPRHSAPSGSNAEHSKRPARRGRYPLCNICCVAVRPHKRVDPHFNKNGVRCGGVFCRSCWNSWQEREATCPHCRIDFSDDVIDYLQEQLDWLRVTTEHNERYELYISMVVDWSGAHEAICANDVERARMELRALEELTGLSYEGHLEWILYVANQPLYYQPPY